MRPLIAWVAGLNLIGASSLFASDTVVDPRNLNISATFYDLAPLSAQGGEDLRLNKNTFSSDWSLCSKCFGEIDSDSGPYSDLEVQRTYNSRTTHNGIFGFGWCSSYETALRFGAYGITETICGAGHTTEFFIDSESPEAVSTKVIDAITAEVTERNPSWSQDQLENLRTDLTHDGPLRDEFARQLGWVGKVVAGIRYSHLGNKSEWIESDGYFITRYHMDGTRSLFDLSGQLTSVHLANGNVVKFLRKQNRLIRVVNENGEALDFEYGANGKVSSVVKSDGYRVTYTYSGDDLVSVNSADGPIANYAYDELHNMLRAWDSSGTIFDVSYNSDKDWVIAVRDQSGCAETYTPYMNTNAPDDNYGIVRRRTCPSESVVQDRWHFQNASNDNGLPRLSEVTRYQDEEVQYHAIISPRTGDYSTLFTREDGEQFFHYDSSGLPTFKFQNAKKWQWISNDSVCRQPRLSLEHVDQEIVFEIRKLSDDVCYSSEPSSTAWGVR